MSGEAAEPGSTSDLLLTEADDGRELEAASGDVISIRLPENPTTGFRWAASGPLGESIVLQSDQFSPGGSAPGAAGERLLRYRAVAPGRSEVELALRRGWEPPGSAQRRVRFLVKVQ